MHKFFIVPCVCIFLSLVVACIGKDNQFPDKVICPSVCVLEKLSPNSDSLSIEDALVLSNLHSSADVVTKASAKKVSDIIPVVDDAGAVLMYAINYHEGGYLLISSTKKYYPILAQVKKGRFSLSDKDNPAIPLIEELKESISFVKEHNVDLHVKSYWTKYEDPVELSRYLTKVEDEWWDQFYDLLYDNYYYNWINAGYNVYFLRNKPEEMPDQLYQQFCSTAQDWDDYGSIGVDYRDVSIILEKVEDNNSFKGPLLNSEWDQVSPWNDYVTGGYYLGCVTVAVGQIMRYHKKPSSFNWEDMPGTYANATVKSFLSGLRTNLNVDNNGGSTIYNAKNVLNAFGYSCSIINHSASSVYSSLFQNRPVYMRGNDSSEGGHAWVCDGYVSLSSQTNYYLYLLETHMGNPEHLSLFNSTSCNFWSLVSYHMNWGWSGDYDGYYVDPNITTSDGRTYHFTGDRKDLLITP